MWNGGGGGLSEPDCLLLLMSGPMTLSLAPADNKLPKYGIFSPLIY